MAGRYRAPRGLRRHLFDDRQRPASPRAQRHERGRAGAGARPRADPRRRRAQPRDRPALDARRRDDRGRRRLRDRHLRGRRLMAEDTWSVAGRTFTSRLIVGTGKYKDFAQNAAAVEASGAEIVTVAVRRVNISDPKQPVLMDFIDPKKVTYLPNTAGCFTADEAIRTLRLAREAGGWTLVKLEVLGEAKTLYPDMIETLRATDILAKEGFEPMVYCADDPIAAKRLEEGGAVAIMPLGAPIGSGLGLQNEVMIRIMVEQARVPVLVDAGVGTASDAAVAMELGCDGVLMNTAIAEAKDPVMMARAMKLAVESGRLAYRAGRMGQRRYADPSSPLAGLI